MKEEYTKLFKIALIIFSIISFIRFIGADILSFFINSMALSNFENMGVVGSSFFPPTLFPEFSFFIYLLTGILFLILTISLWKDYKKGFLLGILGFISYLYISIPSFLDQIAFYGIQGIKLYVFSFVWIILYILAVVFLIYIYRRK